VFKTLPVADRIYRESELPESCAGYARDTITLGWEARLKVHGRRRSDGGVEFGTSLPRGMVLRAGHCLVLDAPRLVVDIVERPEPVFVIHPQTPSEWGLFAYHLGNGHQPLMVTEGALVCPDLPGVESLLQHYRIPYLRADVAFTPVSAVPAHHH
jgi:urease accessory protein UreE